MVTGLLVTLATVMVLILADTFLGIILSIKARAFNVRKLPNFIAVNLFPYIGGLAVLGLAAYFGGAYSIQIAAIFYAAAAATAGKFIAEIKDKAKQIFGKLPVTVTSALEFNDDMKKKLTEAIIEVLQKKTSS